MPCNFRWAALEKVANEYAVLGPKNFRCFAPRSLKGKYQLQTSITVPCNLPGFGYRYTILLLYSTSRFHAILRRNRASGASFTVSRRGARACAIAYYHQEKKNEDAKRSTRRTFFLDKLSREITEVADLHLATSEMLCVYSPSWLGTTPNQSTTVQMV
jgi:hypothetical protein